MSEHPENYEDVTVYGLDDADVAYGVDVQRDGFPVRQLHEKLELVGLAGDMLGRGQGVQAGTSA